MNNWVRFGIIGAVSYLIFLVVTVPASRAYPFAIEQFGKVSLGSLGDLKLYEISGTIWNGKANVATLGNMRVEPFSWTLNPWALLTGSIHSEVTAKSGKNKISATVNRSLFGTIDISELNVDLKLDTIDDRMRTYQTPFTALMASGKIRTTDASLTLSDGMLTAADAQITWIDASVRYRAGAIFKPAQLGSYVINLNTLDDGVAMTFEDRGGAVKAKGNGQLATTGDYTFKAFISPQNNASSDIKNSMQFVGIPQQDGSFLVEYNGTLKTEDAPPETTPPAK